MKEELSPTDGRRKCQVWRFPRHIDCRTEDGQVGGKGFSPRFSRLFWVLVTFFCSALLAVAMQTDSPPCPLSANLTADSRSYRLGEPIEVEVSLINSGDQPIDFLPWNTPFDSGGSGNFFNVHRNGGPVAFLGRMIKRPAPKVSDYQNLAPGATVHARISLGTLYDLTQTGEYRLTCKSPAIPGPEKMQQLCCNTLTFFIEEKTP